LPLSTQARSRRTPRVGGALALSVLLHLLLVALISPFWSDLTQTDSENTPIPVSLVLEVPEQDPVAPTAQPELEGQIVDTPPPELEEVPDRADYLAEHNAKVPEEMQTRSRINPEVLAPTFSRDDELQFENLLDLNIKEPSTGAKVGNDRFDPDRDGRLASLPSPYQISNKDGLQRPVPSSHSETVLSGAPNNDWLKVKRGDRLALNTREILFAGYLNRIRRLVNFYWSQNLQNLPRSAQARLTRSSYDTEVFVVLDGSGNLESVEITRASGSRELDHAVVLAFRIAGPFPNPPSQLIAPDGRVYLPDFGFHAQLNQARARYQGIDPRAGVQFPGILKATQ
jgi:TonB family protein